MARYYLMVVHGVFSPEPTVQIIKSSSLLGREDLAVNIFNGRREGETYFLNQKFDPEKDTIIPVSVEYTGVLSAFGFLRESLIGEEDSEDSEDSEGG